jgi:hypothetical protein
MYEFEILKKVDNTKWNRQLLNCKYSTFFQTAEFLTEDSPGKYPLFLYVYNNNGDVVGQLGITIVKTKRGYSTYTLKKIIETASKLGNRGTWVSGPIIHTEDVESRIKILQSILKALKVIIKENNLMVIGGYTPPQDFHVDEKYKQEFLKEGYLINNFKTYVTDLSQDIDTIWKKVKKNAKNDVSKAERENIQIKEIENKNDLKKFELLSQKWQKTKGIETKDPFASLEKDWRDYNANIQNFFLAYKNDKLLAGLRISRFNGIAYTHQVLNTYSQSGNVGGPLLTWHAIKWAKESGFKTYDFSGGELEPKNEKDSKRYSEQWDSLLSYKRKWGGEEIPYFHLIKIVNKKSYKLFRLASKPDWIFRNYKKKHYKKPKNVN